MILKKETSRLIRLLRSSRRKKNKVRPLKERLLKNPKKAKKLLNQLKLLRKLNRLKRLRKKTRSCECVMIIEFHKSKFKTYNDGVEWFSI